MTGPSESTKSKESEPALASLASESRGVTTERSKSDQKGSKESKPNTAPKGDPSNSSSKGSSAIFPVSHALAPATTSVQAPSAVNVEKTTGSKIQQNLSKGQNAMKEKKSIENKNVSTSSGGIGVVSQTTAASSTATSTSSSGTKPKTQVIPMKLSSIPVKVTPSVAHGTSTTVATTIPTAKNQSQHAAKSQAMIAPKPSPVPASTARTTTTGKKRKAPSPPAPNPTPPSAIAAPAMPLADPAVVKMVHDMVGLLQQYGPLSQAQLEYNLPQPRNGKHYSLLEDVLQLLVAMGIIQKLAGEDKYCTLHGIPRTDVIMPIDVLDELESATKQFKSSLGRIKKLRQALLDKSNAKEVLSEILKEDPEIMNDPVYVTALRNVQVDIATVEKSKIKTKV